MFCNVTGVSISWMSSIDFIHVVQMHSLHILLKNSKCINRTLTMLSTRTHAINFVNLKSSKIRWFPFFRSFAVFLCPIFTANRRSCHISISRLIGGQISGRIQKLPSISTNIFLFLACHIWSERPRTHTIVMSIVFCCFVWRREKKIQHFFPGMQQNEINDEF